jgi:hypothetical protein
VDFRCSENANSLQSPGPCAVDCDFVWQKASVKRKGALERVEVFIRLALEAAAPQAVVFTLGLCAHHVFSIDCPLRYASRLKLRRIDCA